MAARAPWFSSRPRLDWFGLAAFVGLLAIAIHASLAARGLFADGANYLAHMLDVEGFAIKERGRFVVQAIQQAPAVLVLTWGTADPFLIAQVLTAGMLVSPVLLFGLAALLVPSDRAAWRIAPIYTMVAILPVTFAAGIGEGMIAGGLVAVLFALVAFRWDRPFLRLAALALASSAGHWHESTAAALAMIAFLAGRRACGASGSLERATAALVALVLLAASVVAARYALAPRGELSNQANFILSTLGGYFADFETLNAPAFSFAFAGFAALAMYWALWRGADGQARNATLAKARLFGLIAVAVIAIARLAFPETLLSPFGQFAGRGLPVIAITIFIAFFILASFFSLRPESAAPPYLYPILALLLVTNLLSQAAWTDRWQLHVADLRSGLAEHTGIVEVERLVARAPEQRRDGFRRLNWYEMVTPLTVVLAPEGRLRAIAVDSQRGAPRHFDLSEPAKTPGLRFLDASAYVQALERARASVGPDR